MRFAPLTWETPSPSDLPLPVLCAAPERMPVADPSSYTASTADFSAFVASRRLDDDSTTHPRYRSVSLTLHRVSTLRLYASPRIGCWQSFPCIKHSDKRPCNNPPVSIFGLVNHPQLEVSLDAGPALCHYLASDPSVSTAVIYFIGSLDITLSAGHNRCLPPHFSPPRISGSLVPSLTRASLLRGVPLTGSPPLDNFHATL
jgi:hypothetical protein